METVKAYQTKEISTKEFFRSKYETRQLYDEAKILELKNKTLKNASKHNANINFMENEGIIFYSYTFEEKGNHLTTLNELKDYSALSGGEVWKFGFVDVQTGKITFLFNGQYVAQGRNQAFQLFEVAKSVTKERFQPLNENQLIAFASKI